MTARIRFLKKLETENEPDLTDTQLMLTNHDLKPGRFDSSVIVFLPNVHTAPKNFVSTSEMIHEHLALTAKITDENIHSGLP